MIDGGTLFKSRCVHNGPRPCGVPDVVFAVAGLLVLRALVIALLGIETRKRPLEQLRPELIDAAAVASRHAGSALESPLPR